MLIKHKTNNKIMVRVVPSTIPPSILYVKACSATDLKTLTVEEVVETCKLASEVADILRSKGFIIMEQ